MTLTETPIVSQAHSLIKVAEALFKSQLFPNVKNAYGAYAIVEYGAELEIPPMTSLQTMSIISGKICMAAQMMLTFALKKGVSYKVITDSEKEVSVTFSRQGFEPYTSSFSIEEAKRAGIFKAQGGWEKWPRDMCFWRAVTRGLRRIAPDIVLGLYAIEELKDAPPLDSPIDVEEIKPPEPKKPQDKPKPDFDFLKSCGGAKKQLKALTGKDDAYYEVLTRYECLHSNEVKEEDRRTVYEELREKYKTLKAQIEKEKK